MLCRCYCFFSWLKSQISAQQITPISIQEWGATQDVEAAGWGKSSPEKEPTYEKEVNPNPRRGHFLQKQEQNKLNSGHQEVHFY